MILKSARMETPVGPILLLVSGRAVCGLEFEDGRSGLDRWLEGRLGRFAVEAEPDPAGVITRLAAYLAGDLTALDEVPVDTGGTPFQRRVWEQLRRIPAGRTASYAEVAAAIGAPSAVRAVGAANGRNPVAIIVPCHRVIASDGALCGYGGGLDRKRWLLEHEGVQAPQWRSPHQRSLLLT